MQPALKTNKSIGQAATAEAAGCAMAMALELVGTWFLKRRAAGSAKGGSAGGRGVASENGGRVDFKIVRKPDRDHPQVHDQAGIEGAGATACRRTFAVRLHRERYDLRHIREVLGMSSLQATKDLCESDPVSLGRIVARVI